jgi:hypothetical protein
VYIRYTTHTCVGEQSPNYMLLFVSRLHSSLTYPSRCGTDADLVIVGSSIERSLLEPSSKVLSLCRGQRGEGAKCREVTAPRSGSEPLP